VLEAVCRHLSHILLHDVCAYLQVERGGEDAVFTTCSVSVSALGVADGVGGWAEDGIDAAAYSRGFMVACQEAIESTDGSEGGWCKCMYVVVQYRREYRGQGDGVDR
jgi:hypothetical protein